MKNIKANLGMHCNFDKLASIYDLYHYSHDIFVQFIGDENKIDKRTKIVDIGCGTGNDTVSLFNTFKCQIYGIDPSEKMLEKAMKKCQDITWLKGAAEETYLDNNSIDIVTSFFSVHHFSDLNKAAEEFKRILKNTGKIFIFTISHSQMRKSIEYEFFPELLGYDLEKVPSIEVINVAFFKKNFNVKFNELEFEERRIDSKYIEMVENRYRTGFLHLSNKQISDGIERIKKRISKKTELIDKIMCTLLIFEHS